MKDKQLENNVKNFIASVEKLEVEQRANQLTVDTLSKDVSVMQEASRRMYEDLDIAANAIAILTKISDEAVTKSYDFIAESLNASLERIFVNTKRKIRIKEYTRGGQYPQLELELTVEGGKIRSLKSDSGHGLAQIVSLLCVLCLIVITDSRRFLAIDEVLSGLSANSRRIIAEIMWSFAEIGFQFVVSEHGFIPKGAKVYELEMSGGISNIDGEYIEQNGVFLGVDMQSMDESTGDVPGELKGGSVIMI